MIVEFKFDIDQEVITPFGLHGIIQNCDYDDGRINQYYLKLENGQSGWYKESQISEVDK